MIKQIEYSQELVDLIFELSQVLGRDDNIEDISTNLNRLYERTEFIALGYFAEDKLVGILGGVKTNNLGNRNKLEFAEQFWYVKPQYRGVGMKLIKHLENMLKDVTITIGVADPKLVKLLELHGYKRIKYIMEK